MAKSGAPSNVAEARGGARSAGTRLALVDAAIETLKTDGYVGASARAIADRPAPTRRWSSTTSARSPISCWPRSMGRAPPAGALPRRRRRGRTPRSSSTAPEIFRDGPRPRTHHGAGRDDRRGLLDTRPRARGGRPDRAWREFARGGDRSARSGAHRSDRVLPRRTRPTPWSPSTSGSSCSVTWTATEPALALFAHANAARPPSPTA